MAILVSLFGALGRFAGKIVNAALGWASILLFGRVPQSKQILLSVVTLGSIVAVAAFIGTILPDLGTFLIAAVPAPNFVDRNLIRLVMVAIFLVVPLAAGVAALFLVRKEDRPKGVGPVIWQVLHGYVFCAVLAFMLVFLAAVALIRKGYALVKRWEDAHVPIVVKPGRYGDVVNAVCDALDQAGLGLTEGGAPQILAAPPKVLSAVAGSGVKDMVPDRLMELRSPTLEVLVYPSDIALAGTKKDVARSRAAIASRLTAAPAYLTTSAESQEVEDRIEALSHGILERRRSGASDADMERQIDEIDVRLANLVVPYDEWEVLYRMRLQVEREMLTGQQPGQTLAAGVVEAETGTRPRSQPVNATTARRGREREAAGSRLGLAASWIVSIGGFALVGLDAALTLIERFAPPRNRSRFPWQNSE